MKARRALTRLGIGLIVPVAVIIVWTIVATASPNVFWPSPIAIARVFPETWFHGRILDDIVPTLVRLLSGYALAVIVGVPAGLAIGSSRRLRLFFEPLRDLLRAIPPTLLVPVVMVFAGIGDEMKVIVIFWGCFWAVLLNTTEGVRAIDEVQLDTAKSYGISRWRMVWRIVLPGATPQITAGARQALAIAVIMAVISEMFAASNGVGFNVIQFQRSFAVPEMWTGMIVLGVIGVLLNLIFQLVERRLILPWHYGMQRAEQ